MPKMRDRTVKDKPINIHRNHNVGTRKAGKAAHQMSNQALLDALGSENYKRSRNKIKHVLVSRGVTI